MPITAVINIDSCDRFDSMSQGAVYLLTPESSIPGLVPQNMFKGGRGRKREMLL